MPLLTLCLDLHISINLKTEIMKKYFGNKQEWTIEELKNLVAQNPQLGFYFQSIICTITGNITIHNFNGEFKGHSRQTFKQIENKNWVRN